MEWLAQSAWHPSGEATTIFRREPDASIVHRMTHFFQVRACECIVETQIHCREIVHEHLNV
jgi:hypothetical protein